MKILYIANAAQIGGGNKSLLSMAQKTSTRYTVHILVPQKGSFCDLLEDAGLDYSVANINFRSENLLNYFKTFLKVFKIVYNFSPDIIHINDLFCYRIPSLVAKFFRIPIILHIRFSVEREAINYFMKIKPSCLIFNSRYMQEEFFKKNSSLKNKINFDIVYNFFDPEEYYYPDLRKDVREKLGLLNQFVIGIVGNFYPVKGHEYLLKSIKILVNENQSIKLLIIGQDLSPNKENEKRIKGIVSSLNIDKNVIFLGFQRKIGPFLSALDVLVVPSLYEPFGRVAVEGLLAGIPVIGSKTGGLIEILEEAPHGYLVSPASSEDLSLKIKEILSLNLNYPLLDNRQYAINKFSANKNFQKLLKIYESFC